MDAEGGRVTIWKSSETVARVVSLTHARGGPCWVRADRVEALLPSGDEDGGTDIWLETLGALTVTESPEDVAKALWSPDKPVAPGDPGRERYL